MGVVEGFPVYLGLVKRKRFWFFSGMKVAFSHLESFLEELRQESASVHRSILRVMIYEDGYDLYVIAGAVIGGELVEGRMYCGCLTGKHEKVTRDKAEFVYDKIARGGQGHGAGGPQRRF